MVAFIADFERKVHAKLRDLDTANRPLAEALTELIRLQLQMKAPYHRFVRVFFAQMFLHTDQFLTHMASDFIDGDGIDVSFAKQSDAGVDDLGAAAGLRTLPATNLLY